MPADPTPAPKTPDEWRDALARTSDRRRREQDEIIGAPTPAPEWARKMADTCTGMTYDFIAILFASVRDAALREAASVIPALYVNGVAHRTHDARAILALVGTAPKDA